MFFDTVEELGEILDSISPETYRSRLEAVKENIEITKSYMNIPDFIYENYKSELEQLTKKV
jgi:hypothetical protein